MILGGVRFVGLPQVIGGTIVVLDVDDARFSGGELLACAACGKAFLVEGWQEQFWCPYCGRRDCPVRPAARA